MDPDLARLAEDHHETHGSDDSNRAPELAVSESTPEVQLLLRLIRLTELLLQQRSRKRIPFPPLPTMRTARAAEKRRRRVAHRERLHTRIAEAQALWTRLQDSDQEPPPATGREYFEEVS